VDVGARFVSGGRPGDLNKSKCNTCSGSPGVGSSSDREGGDGTSQNAEAVRQSTNMVVMVQKSKKNSGRL
jgi:hypothetical protein